MQANSCYQMYQRVRALSRTLLLGTSKGDRIALIGENRWEAGLIRHWPKESCQSTARGFAAELRWRNRSLIVDMGAIFRAQAM